MRTSSPQTEKDKDDKDERRHGFRFIPTLSWDSVTVILGLAISGFLYVQTIKSDQSLLAERVSSLAQVQKSDIAQVQKSVDRVEADVKERLNTSTSLAKERSDRIESLVKDQQRIVQDVADRLRK